MGPAYFLTVVLQTSETLLQLQGPCVLMIPIYPAGPCLCFCPVRNWMEVAVPFHSFLKEGSLSKPRASLCNQQRCKCFKDDLSIAGLSTA